MTTVAIHQPNYIPWLGYFYKVVNCDVFVFLDNVQYEKNSYVNRNKIKTTQGELWLTVDVITKGRHDQPISQVAINNSVSWNRRHWKSIQQNYSKASYYNSYQAIFESTYHRPWDRLYDLNEHLIMSICNILSLKETEFLKASDLNVSGQSTELLVNICKAVGANTYLSGFGGANYMDEDKFREAGIELRYYNFKHPIYSQLWGDFVPNLSIVDLLLNEGDRSLRILKNQQQ